MKKQFALAVALACTASLAQAQQAKPLQTGVYAGISGGRSDTAFTAQDYSLNLPATVSESTDTHDAAWRVFVGYSFTENWAVEGAYTSLGDAKYKYAGLGALAGQSAEAKIDRDSWSLAVKGTLPVSKEFDVFALLGATSNHVKLDATMSAGIAAAAGAPTTTSESHTRSYGMVGLGIEYKPTSNVGIRAEYQNLGKFGDSTNTGRSDGDAWLIGVRVKF